PGPPGAPRAPPVGRPSAGSGWGKGGGAPSQVLPWMRRACGVGSGVGACPDPAAERGGVPASVHLPDQSARATPSFGYRRPFALSVRRIGLNALRRAVARAAEVDHGRAVGQI